MKQRRRPYLREALRGSRQGSSGRRRMFWLLASVAALVPVPGAAAPEIIPSIALEIYMRDTYPRLWNHKALAIGPAGVFAPSYRAKNTETAERLAIKRCEERLKWHRLPALRTAKCRLYATEDTVVLKNASPATPPRNVETYVVRKSLSSKPRAKLLFLSECGAVNRNSQRNDWHTGWLDLLAVRGFEVVAPVPDRAGTRCGRSVWAKDAATQKRRNFVRALIKSEKKNNPSLPLYVWGHGAGAAVALSLDRQVSGIITTGYPCTYGQTRGVLVHPQTRVLVVMGEKQAGIDVASRRAGVHAVSEFCATVLKQKHQRAVIIKGMEKRAEISRPSVHREVARFFQIAVPQLKPSDPSNIKMLGYEALMRYNVAYRRFSNHKVVLLGPDDKDYVSVARDSVEEAEQAALFDCHRDQTGNGFVSTPETVCVLFVRDDDIVLPQLAEPIAD